MLSNKSAIVGIGETEFSKNSGRSELQLASECVLAALTDAGLTPKDVDGFVSMTFDTSDESEVARAIGAGDLTYYGRAPYGGGGACGPVQQAAMAIALGVAEVVVCWRAMNERSQYRFGDPNAAYVMAPLIAYHTFQGLGTPAANLAVAMQRYMYETGTTYEDFGRVAVAARRHAANNPAAFFHGKPITLDDYMASRMIANPFRLLDCCQESDGGVAIVMTTAERARSLRHRPVAVAGAAQGAPSGILPLPNFYRNDIVPREEVCLVANQLYDQADLCPKDIDLAIIYDHFSPTVLPTLEAYGFCGYGDAKDFIKDGNIEIGGLLPVNTHGGMTGEAYIHGMNGVAEAVRQLRGVAINQVDNAQHAIVTAASFMPTGGLILSAA